jgi:dihydropteroate synthase
MGILNITPDSFSDGGRYFSVDAAVSHALELQAQGADIIDIGGQSTRPGADCISAQEEISRIAPVLENLRGKIRNLSVDTFYAEVADFALEHGVTIVNDVSGMPTAAMANTVRHHSAGWIIMHNPGGQSGATSKSTYSKGIIETIQSFIKACLFLTKTFGVEQSSLCFDPGFGFGKTHDEHVQLFQSLQELESAYPILVGISRKRFVREIFTAQTESELDIASAALHAIAYKKGVQIIRTHNVALTRQLLSVI